MRLFEIEETELGKLRQDIEANCQPYLKMVDKNVNRWALFRGIKADFDYKVRDVRQDRKPMTSDEETHDALVAAFAQAGIKANRNNSVFCSGDPRMASDYGNLYQIFPIGNFDYSWAEEIPDLFHWVEEHFNVDPAMYPTMIKQAYHSNAFFKEAIESGNEIMIACKQYYLVKNSVMQELF